jgi:hypothetical protein
MKIKKGQYLKKRSAEYQCLPYAYQENQSTPNFDPRAFI